MLEIPEAYRKGNYKGCSNWDNEAHIFQDALNIIEPTRILEIGFFSGCSAFMMLHLAPNAYLVSVDPMTNTDNNMENVNKVYKDFPNRFHFIREDSKKVNLDGSTFDLIFIDGDHSEEGIRNDFNLALSLNIPWLLVDDFVTSVAKVYFEEFQDKFLEPIRIYPRKDTFMGQPIPIVLLRKKN